jgi:ribosomal protein L37E
MIDAKKLPAWLQKIILSRRMKANGGHLYFVEALGDNHITCLICGKTSYSADDVRHKFCIRCGYFKDAERDLYIPKKNRYAG